MDSRTIWKRAKKNIHARLFSAATDEFLLMSFPGTEITATSRTIHAHTWSPVGLCVSSFFHFCSECLVIMMKTDRKIEVQKQSSKALSHKRWDYKSKFWFWLEVLLTFLLFLSVTDLWKYFFPASISNVFITEFLSVLNEIIICPLCVFLARIS